MNKKDDKMLEKTVDGKYTLIGLKERGDAFQSYLAHYHLLGTQVMVDIVHPGRLPGGAAPLEARLEPLPTLRHPSVSRVFAWGEEESYLYVVREFTHGCLLSDLLQEAGGLPAAQALELTRRLVEGLGALHGRGIYYTGLNPHQVWVNRKGEGAIVRPGYSILLECEDRRFSREAAPYWAPEVISGGEGTRSSDVFSLGMMARRLLSSEKDNTALWNALREAGAHDPARRTTSARVFLEQMEAAMAFPGDPETGRDPEGVKAVEGMKLPPAVPPAGEPAAPPPRERPLELVRSHEATGMEGPSGRKGGMKFPLKLALAGLVIAAVILAMHFSGSSSRSRQQSAANQAVTVEEAPPEPQLVMPDLRGMDQAEARRLLQEMGLEVELVSEPSNVVPEGKVIIQEPLKGENMRKGHKVRVYVSTGPLQRQAADLSVPSHFKDIFRRDPLPGRGSATRGPHGPGGPKEFIAACRENPSHGI